MVRGLTGRALAVRETPRAYWRLLVRSPRLRVLRLLRETSPWLLVMLGLFVVADGFLPIVALVALGRAVGHIPDAVKDGLGSASGHALLIALVFGVAAYALSLLRYPAEDLLSAHASAVMSTGMQRRLARAVCAPVGVEHLEDSAVLDQLAAASGELSTSGPADAPMALASAFGDRLSGFIACVVLATFRWYIGVLFFVGWSLLRPPLPDDDGDREPVRERQRLAEDHQAGQRREHRVDAHEHAEEPGRDPPQRQHVGHHRDRRAQQAGRGRPAQRGRRYRLADQDPDADRDVQQRRQAGRGRGTL